MRRGWSDARLHEVTNIDPWFIAQMRQLMDAEVEIATRTLE